MEKIKYKSLLVFSIIVFILMAFLIDIKNVKGEETNDYFQKASNEIFEIEISNNLNFDGVLESVLSQDIKYIVNPDLLKRDLLLSEIIIKDLDYSSYELQQVEVKILRFVPSKLEKVKIDSIKDIVSIKFIDTTLPEIIFKNKELIITQGQKLDLNDNFIGVKDNSFDSVVLEVVNDVNPQVVGEYKVVYTATDKTGNKAFKEIKVIVKEKPKPKKPVIKEGLIYRPSLVTRYGYDCRGCRVNDAGYSSTAAGIHICGDKVKQAHGEWLNGLTYEGYYIVATSKSIPMFSILKISEHPFSGSGIISGQPFYAIVGDRGVGGTTLDLFIGTEKDMNKIVQKGNPKSMQTKVEIVRLGR